MDQLYWQIRQWFDIQIDEGVVFLFLVPLTLLTLFLAYHWGLNRVRQLDYIDDNDLSYFKVILRYKIILILIFAFVWLPSPFESIVLAPFSIVASILPLFVFLRILEKKYSKFDRLNILSVKSQEDLNENVANLLNSSNFLTALRATLPRGEKDAEYGLDYVPYMLKNVEERRVRFTKRAHGFLITSIAAGTLFVGITLWLGYILLDEDSIGTGKAIRDLESYTKELSTKLSYVAPELYLEIEEYKAIIKRIAFIEKTAETYKNNEIKASIEIAISDFRISKDLDGLQKKIDGISIPYDSSDLDDSNLRNELNRLNYQITDFRSVSESSIRQVPQLVGKIEGVIENSEKLINKTENRTPEIVKRLILSVVILSFFLAILRFLTAQYRKNIEQLIQSEQDDLYIRKTYIALKTAGENEEAKKIVLSQLLSKIQNSEIISKSTSNENLSLAKELIETLAKKL